MEFAEYFAYWLVEPWGAERADLRAGIIAATTANIHRRKGRRAYKPGDFIPKYGEGHAKQTPEDMLGIIEAAGKSIGAKDLRKKEE